VREKVSLSASKAGKWFSTLQTEGKIEQMLNFSSFTMVACFFSTWAAMRATSDFTSSLRDVLAAGNNRHV